MQFGRHTSSQCSSRLFYYNPPDTARGLLLPPWPQTLPQETPAQNNLNSSHTLNRRGCKESRDQKNTEHLRSKPQAPGPGQCSAARSPACPSMQTGWSMGGMVHFGGIMKKDAKVASASSAPTSEDGAKLKPEKCVTADRCPGRAKLLRPCNIRGLLLHRGKLLTSQDTNTYTCSEEQKLRDLWCEAAQPI